MAFFGSKSYERALKRTPSTDRLRHTHSSSKSQSQSQHQSSASRTTAQRGVGVPTIDEFGVLAGKRKEQVTNAHQISVSTSTSASAPAGASSSSSSLNKPPVRTRTVSRTGSASGSGNGSGSGSIRRTSHSPNPVRNKRNTDASSSSPPSTAAGTESPRTRLNSGASVSASGGRKAEAVARARSSPDLMGERGAPRVRSKTSLRAQAAGDEVDNEVSTNVSSSGRPPRGPYPPDMRSAPFPSSRTTTTQQNNNNLSHSPASYSISSSSSSPLSLPGSNNASLRKHAHPHAPTHPPSPSASLALPSTSNSNSNSNPNSISKSGKSKSTPGGNVSDGSCSYGSPLSELGIGFSVKRLLSKPAASNGVRSEPDTNAEYLGSYGARRRGGGEMEGLGASLRERKPATSDPEMPRGVLGSLGRARGLEWGHVLGREQGQGQGQGQGHMREDSTVSASSPSEGATYPYGLVNERRAAKGARPLIQLTTSAVRRLSALGAREVDRDRDRPPHTPMSFGAAAASTPLTGNSVNARSRANRSPQPSPSSSTPTTTTTTTSCVMPVGLTPAEIVLHSYKEQERRRAELEREVGRDASTPEKLHAGGGVSKEAKETEAQAQAQRTVRVKNNEERERASLLTRRASADVTSAIRRGDGSPTVDTAGPYYTVFGEPSGRVVAIGSARDSAWGLFGQEGKTKARGRAVVAEINLAAAATAMDDVYGAHGATTTTTVSGSEGKGGGSKTLRRKLSRKMSGKFRRDGSLVARGGKEGSEGRDEFNDVLSGGEDGYGTDGYGYGYGYGHGYGYGSLGGRPSLSLNTSSSGRKSATLPREKEKSAGAGSGAGLQPLKISMDGFVTVQRTESVSGRMLPSAVNGSPQARAFGGVKDRNREKDREKDREKEKEKEKGKLWGLVKRISSNTLKDKYRRSSAEVVPPVPALPRDYERASASASPTFDGDRDGTRGTRERERERERVDSTTSGKLRLDTRARVAAGHGRRPSTAPALSAMESGSGNGSGSGKEGRFTTLRKKPSASVLHSLGPSPVENVSSSTTTATYSPFSSDVVNPRKEYGRSSVSSLRDLIASDGKEMLGQHILPPETLFMFDDFNLNFESDERKEEKVVSGNGKPVSRNARGGSSARGSLFYGEESEPASHQALPVPPRRATQIKPEHEDIIDADADDDDDDEFRSESPTIPSFSADNAINTFGFRNRSGTTNTSVSVASAFTGADFGGVDFGNSPQLVLASSHIKTPSEPPPRPPRSSRRGAASILHSQSSSSHGSHSHSPSSSLARTIFEDRMGRASIGAHSQASTARPSISRSPSSSPSPPPELLDSQSPVSASDSASSTMTFRDMSGMASKPSWSEKEKLDKWNDLLDRSEKAGGTLHVGVGGLLSDHIRDSAYEPIRDSAYLEF